MATAVAMNGRALEIPKRAPAANEAIAAAPT
jgi:hypothetical protein